MTNVRLDQAAIRALAGNSGVKDGLDRVGSQVADRARAAAPRRTGAGAESISHEVGTDSTGAFVHVSWDRDHFYMLFHEIGTSKTPARPFLRPALDGSYTP